MSARPDRTNATRLLDAREVPYEALTYDPVIHSANGVAQALGLPVDCVYKTLVVLPEDGAARSRPLLVMVAGDRELDARRLARSLGLKSVRMALQKEAERLTGLQVGGIGALALTGKSFTVCLDRPAVARDWILVNGGRRGLNLRVAVPDLIALTQAQIVDASPEPAV